MADAPGVETPVTWHSSELTTITTGAAMHVPLSIDFWGELDADVLRCLAEREGGMTPAEIGRNIGISEQAVSSIVGMLVETGRVRITSVEQIV
jgi:predicted transcriptional regulator